MAATLEPGEPGKGKPFKLRGILDVANVPCAWDSVLYGSLGSVVAGLGHFLLTSRIRRSSDVGVGGLILVTLGCWFHCRYKYAKQRIQERIAREGIKNKILYESTHLDPERKQTNSDSSNEAILSIGNQTQHPDVNVNKADINHLNTLCTVSSQSSKQSMCEL
uniref:Cytochrome c oxidase assembly protein COX20, mitochondrial n=1 Tax=Propithecus coquereli TaxID=379532 RepID=A0A2K6GPW3_PROCO